MRKHRYSFPRLSKKRGGLLNFSDYSRIGPRIAYGVFVGLMVIFVLFALLPIIWLCLSALKPEAELDSVHYTFFPVSWQWGRIGDLWNRLGLGRFYLNTLIYVAGAVVCAVLFNSLLAYGVACIKPIGYKVVDKLIFLGYMIPGILNILPLIRQLADLGLFAAQESYALFIPLWLCFGANAYYYMLFKDYFQQLPRDLIEASRIDGANQLQVFWHIALPLSRPIIGIVAVFAMTAAYSDFLFPYLVLNNAKYQTIVVGIYHFGTNPSDFGLQTADFLMLLVMSIIPQVLIFLIFQRQIMNVNVNSGSKE